jgi:DNA-binding Xre family transcriptional regulator/PHD/YefM family antitoxin component YafN of YafNO toxin-antitoxin module
MNEMFNRQVIIAPSGERMVVLPEADYLALVERLEDAEDIATANAVLERIARGEEELIPSAVVERLLDGVNPITVWREHRGMTISALADQAGLSQSYLSQIEAGKREGRIGVLSKLARALSVDLDDLVPAPEAVE